MDRVSWRIRRVKSSRLVSEVVQAYHLDEVRVSRILRRAETLNQELLRRQPKVYTLLTICFSFLCRHSHIFLFCFVLLNFVFHDNLCSSVGQRLVQGSCLKRVQKKHKRNSLMGDTYQVTKIKIMPKMVWCTNLRTSSTMASIDPRYESIIF